MKYRIFREKKRGRSIAERMGLANSRQFKQAQILMLGLDSAGKSTLLYKLKFNDVFQTSPTIGFNVEMIETVKDLALTIWDVGGQHQMRAAWSNYLENVDSLVYVVDSTDNQRLEEAKKELELLLRNDRLKNVPVVVLANKQDLPGALSAEEITRRLNMKKLCHDRNCASILFLRCDSMVQGANYQRLTDADGTESSVTSGNAGGDLRLRSQYKFISI